MNKAVGRIRSGSLLQNYVKGGTVCYRLGVPQAGGESGDGDGLGEGRWGGGRWRGSERGGERLL